jgi:protein subunit release factor B
MNDERASDVDTKSPDPEKILSECRITYMLPPGPGGQRRDRKRTAVRLVHGPTGITVIAGRKRYRAHNLKDALDRLIARIEERTRVRRPRIPTKTPRRVRMEIKEAKRRRSEKKRQRRKVAVDEE